MTDTETGEWRPARETTWAGGISVFAATLMILVGGFQCLQGLVAVLNGDEFLARVPDYFVAFDATTWGWIHLVIGAAIALSGILIFAGNPVARGAGIAVAGLAALSNFAWLPYYPVWGFLVISLDVLVIWALATSNIGDR